MNGKEIDMKHCVVTILFVLMVMSAACTTEAPLNTEDPWTGTWILNPEKSKAPGGRIPHPTSVNIITVRDNTVTMVADHTDTQGRTEHVEYTAVLDGNMYPVKSVPPGPDPYTIALRNIDARTREFVEILGTRTIKGLDILSEDGKTFSRVVEMRDPEGNDNSIIQFFEKQ